MTTLWRWAAVGIVLCLLSWSSGWNPSVSQADEPQRNERGWNDVVQLATRYLRESQGEDGSFSQDKSIGITGVVMTGLLRCGHLDMEDPMIRKGLGYIEKLIDPQSGHIAGMNPRQQLKNYVTSVNVMALAAANASGRYQAIVDRGAKFLTELQWDEGENITAANNFFGGFGYDSKNRPDMSNTNMAMDALKAAGLSPDHPAFKKAMVFVSRSQNLKSEHQDQPWAGLINDGSFIYSPAGEGETKADPLPGGGLPGTASMTYAGIKSMIYAGVSKDDPRVKAALAWVRKNYSLEENVGMPPGRRQFGLYYYYHTMAKCFDTLGVDEFEDEQGRKHDWRKEMTEALAKRQRPDGSWLNEQDRWMEGDPNLVTGYALMTLSYCKPKK